MFKLCTTAIRKDTARLVEINGYFHDFPPYQPNQVTPMDEFLAMLKFIIPVSWKHQMTFHGIDSFWVNNSAIYAVLQMFGKYGTNSYRNKS